ncbi:hypothetical protein C474_09187 [Halogeometricum pallidum JCM 14848]|uniref:Uncharacterized protein n=1 Tax=Halogeometricum pallidum JCM 14848 TaxID=1227487 RepID=M0D9H5_HALPD|nr:hypothetical protein [Halogeometricum pallidum]ELZ31463.1 hypothetical protein C474_09187 [Halogeometricum pallidum JCM 14848]
MTPGEQRSAPDEREFVERSVRATDRARLPVGLAASGFASALAGLGLAYRSLRQYQYLLTNLLPVETTAASACLAPPGVLACITAALHSLDSNR